MTVKEKSKALGEWCKTQDKCSLCVLYNKRCCYSYIEGDANSEKRVCKNYEVVFGKDEHESDSVNHPSHYQGKNECIDVMVAMFGEEAVKHFCMCNAYKYRFRADKKNGEEDIKKAEWYESKLIELGGIDGSKVGTN